MGLHVSTALLGIMLAVLHAYSAYLPIYIGLRKHAIVAALVHGIHVTATASE